MYMEGVSGEFIGYTQRPVRPKGHLAYWARPGGREGC